MSKAMFIALKDLKLLLRDRAALFWILLFPLLFSAFLGSLFHSFTAESELRLRVALSDLDQTEEASRYIDTISREPSLTLTRTSVEAGRSLLRRGEVDAFLMVLPGFGERADFYANETEVLRIESDPGKTREARLLQGLLIDVGARAGAELMLLPDPRDSVRIVPGTMARELPKPAEIVTPVALLWSLIGCAAAFAVSLAMERQRGTFARLRSAGVTEREMLTGKALACWVSCCAVALTLLALAALCFGVRAEQPLALLFVIACSALAFTGLMAALSTFGKTERAVAGAGWATLLFLGMVGGVMAPRMVMPPWLDALGQLTPVRWGMVALEHVLYRGGSLQDWLVPSGQLVALGCFGIALGAVVLKRSAT